MEKKILNFFDFINESIVDQIKEKVEKGIIGTEKSLPSTTNYRGTSAEGISGPAVKHANSLIDLFKQDKAGVPMELLRELNGIAQADPGREPCDEILGRYLNVLKKIKEALGGQV